MLQQHEKDAFKLLGIKPGSDAATVRKAWRALVRTYHPDLAKTDPVAANARLAEINSAFDLLTEVETAPAARTGKQANTNQEQKASARRKADAARRRKQAQEHAQEHARTQQAARAKAEERAAEARDAAERQAAADRAAAQALSVPASPEDALQRLARLSFERARRVYSGQTLQHGKQAFA